MDFNVWISIATPIVIGMILNLIIYFVLNKNEKTKDVSIKFTWYAVVAMLIFSYLLSFISTNTWGGFGYFIITLGMFAMAFVLTIIKYPIWKTSKDMTNQDSDT